jgi:hypothetical protein
MLVSIVRLDVAAIMVGWVLAVKAVGVETLCRCCVAERKARLLSGNRKPLKPSSLACITVPSGCMPVWLRPSRLGQPARRRTTPATRQCAYDGTIVCILVATSTQCRATVVAAARHRATTSTPDARSAARHRCATQRQAHAPCTVTMYHGVEHARVAVLARWRAARRRAHTTRRQGTLTWVNAQPRRLACRQRQPLHHSRRNRSNKSRESRAAAAEPCNSHTAARQDAHTTPHAVHRSAARRLLVPSVRVLPRITSCRSLAIA